MDRAKEHFENRLKRLIRGNLIELCMPTDDINKVVDQLYDDLIIFFEYDFIEDKK